MNATDESSRIGDPDFVASATMQEAGAKERARQAERAHRRGARRLKRARRHDWFRRYRSTLAVVVVGSILVAALYDVRVRQQHARTAAATKTAKAAAVESAGPTSSTSTTIGLESRLYNVGDCVVWDFSAVGSERRATHVVPCGQPHIIEIAGSVQVNGFDHYPTDAEWRGFIEPNCRPVAEQALLHGPIDPIGRFGANGIYTLPDGWGQGDRTVWCGVEAKLLHERAGDNDKELFTGEAERAHQAFDYPVGTCLALTHDGGVACSGPHAYEVIGKVDLSARTDPPPPPDQASAWDKLLNAPCQAAFR